MQRDSQDPTPFISRMKYQIEQVHLEYVLSTFNLEAPNSQDIYGTRPDLLGVDKQTGEIKILFELKTKIFPHGISGRGQYKSQFEWYELDDNQIKRYERARRVGGFGLNWIFLIADTKKRFDNLDEINEDSILSREIYVVPWFMYKEVKMTPTGYRHLGLGKVRRRNDFTEREIPKGRLFIARSVEDDVGKYFQLRQK